MVSWLTLVVTDRSWYRSPTVGDFTAPPNMIVIRSFDVNKPGAEVDDIQGGRDAQPALVIGRHYVTERDSAPVQYNGIL